jgi:hypothetical protein
MQQVRMGGTGWLGILLACVLSACGDGVGNDGDVVGGPCQSNDDCDSDSMCEDSGDFPGGTCTVECESDSDCPDGTRCVDKDSGICLLECESPDDCRNGYGCEEKSVKDDGGKANVCID